MSTRKKKSDCILIRDWLRFADKYHGCQRATDFLRAVPGGGFTQLTDKIWKSPIAWAHGWQAWAVSRLFPHDRGGVWNRKDFFKKYPLTKINARMRRESLIAGEDRHK